MNIFITKCKIDHYVNEHIIFIKNTRYKCRYVIGDATYRKIIEMYDIEEDLYICSYYYENFIEYFYTEQEIRKLKLDKLKSL